mgnify:CR=1 FL=1
MKKLFALVLALLILVMPVCVLAADGDNVNDTPRFDDVLTDDVNTAFIEPDYYPDYDVAPAPMPAPEKAPKTGDFSMLPQLMLAVAAAGSLVVASKRAK